MDGRSVCCIARYAGGGDACQEKKMMERAMLKFRPIAPKPATGACSAFGSSSPDTKTSSGDTTYVKAAGRGKRKYNMANINNKRRGFNGEGRKLPATISNDNDTSRGESSRVTLSLLPESPTDHLMKNDNSRTPTSRTGPSTPISWLSFNSQQNQAVESVVTVECLTHMYTCDGDQELGRMDEERLRTMEWDTCPGFITDGQMQVKWINKAYEKVACVNDHHQLVVSVDMKDEKVKEARTYPSFTCRVRVQQKGIKEIKILPCDVWRMDCGGFAWRLDVNAALSLGRC